MAKDLTVRVRMRPSTQNLLNYLDYCSDLYDKGEVRTEEGHFYKHVPGQLWVTKPCPEEIIKRYSEKKACFRNAAMLAIDYPDELTYVEGWAHSLIPCAHAWCVDNKGRVVDPTWHQWWEDAAYWGVPFKTSIVKGTLLKYGTSGMFDLAGRKPDWASMESHLYHEPNWRKKEPFRYRLQTSAKDSA